AEIALPAAAVLARVAVQELAPVAAAGHPDLVALPRHRGEVCDDERLAPRRVPAQVRQHARLGIVAVHPLEAARVEVALPERGLRPVDAVQVLHPAAHARVRRQLEQAPLEPRLVVPLAPLPELAAHEEQLLARMRVEKTEQATQIREPLPIVAWHLAEQRALSVDDLVMRKRQHEVLGERVPEPESEALV